jgi:hypothetical protein
MMKATVIAALVAAASAQEVARRQTNAQTELFQYSQQTAATLSTLNSQMTTNLAEIATLSRQLAATSQMAAAQQSGALNAIVPITAQIMNVANDLVVDSTTNNLMLEALGSTAMALDATVAASAMTLNSTVNGMTNTINSQITSMNVATNSALTGMINAVNTTINTQVDRVTSTVSSTLVPLGMLRSSMSTSHYMRPATPFFRWHMFHVYSNNGVGWFDGNNVRHFGGRNPSNWGDGNARVWDMHPDIQFLGRIFTRRGVGAADGSGATVCSETWYLYSSTDTKYCIALFRIKNTRTSTINYAARWYGTGWSGWGNQQSATMNGNVNWAASCTWWCQRDRTWAVPANAQGNRVSTLIYANGMSHPNHYADNHHIEATFLGFDGLTPPAGLEFVDDLSTATGQWR